MTLGSTLNETNELRTISNHVTEHLLCKNVSDRRMISHYLEAAASWDFIRILEFLEKCVVVF